jgi:hypothetical protein
LGIILITAQGRKDFEKKLAEITEERFNELKEAAKRCGK